MIYATSRLADERLAAALREQERIRAEWRESEGSEEQREQCGYLLGGHRPRMDTVVGPRVPGGESGRCSSEPSGSPRGGEVEGLASPRALDSSRGNGAAGQPQEAHQQEISSASELFAGAGGSEPPGPSSDDSLMERLFARWDGLLRRLAEGPSDEPRAECAECRGECPECQ